MKSTIKFLTISVIVLVFTLNVFSQVPNYVPTNGLVGYWPFNGNANDASGNNLNGTLIGSPQLSIDRFGNNNQAYDFNYSNAVFSQQNQEIYIPYNSILDVNNITVSYWIFPRSYYWSGNPNLTVNISRFQYGYSNPNGQVWGIGFTDTQVMGGLNGPQGGGDYSASYNSPITLNTWNNIVLTFDGANIELFLNGNLVATTPHALAMNTLGNSGISIGENNSANGYWQYTDGIMDDIGIWNRALTPQEITNLYTSTVPPTAAVLSGDATICAGASTNLSVAVTGGSAPYTVTVTDGTNNYSATGASPVSIAVSPTATSTYSIVSVTGGGTGTGNTGTAIVTVIDATITASDSVICAGETVTLSVPQGGSSNTACAALPTNLQTGLVGYWPFCGNANDASGNGNNGTVNGATLTTDRFGSANSAYYFNGSSSSITINSNFYDNGWNENSIGLWFKPNSNNINGCLLNTIPHDGTAISFGNYGTNQKLYFGKNSDPDQHLWNIIGGNLGNHEFSYPIFNYNEWYFITITKNGNTYDFYINGVFDHSTVSTVSPISYYCAIILGNLSPNQGYASEFYKGDLDDFSVWNRALSASEIQQLYTLGQTTYLWSNGATTPTINVSPTSTTTYTCTTTINGVSCTDSVTVVVNNPTIDLGNDVTVCGTSTTLTAPTGFDSYLWSNGAITNTTTVTANGTYTCTVTQGGCSISDTLEVVLITLDAQASSTSICAGAAVELTGASNLNLNQNSNCIGNTGSPNPWPYPSAYNAGIVDLGNFGAQNVFSVSAWLNVGATQNGISIFLDASHGGSANWVVQAFGNNTYTWGSLSFTLSPNVWQHVLLTYVNGSKKCYIDGQLVASVFNPISYSGSPQLYLGNWPEGGRRFNGLVDELYITYSELESANFTPSQVVNSPSSNSFGLWHFDEGSNGTAVNSVNGSAAQIGSWFWATRPIVSNATISWNGVPGASVQTVSPQITTTYVSSVLINGLTCTDSVTVVVNNPTIDLGNDVTACGTSTTLTAPTGFDSYLWSNGATTNTTTVSANGTYSCTVSQGGCSASDSIDVSLIDVTISASDSTICAGETVTLSIPQGGSSNTACVALPTNLQTGLVGYWPFCGNANDASGNGNNGTVNGATLTTDRFGNANSAYSFDGVNDNVVVPNSSSFQTNTWTINAWFKTSFLGHNRITSKDVSGASTNDFSLIILYGNLYISSSINGATNNPIPLCTEFVADDIWHNVVASRSNGTFNIYIDGNFCTSVPDNFGNLINSNILYIGSPFPYPSQYFNGKLDDIAIYNRALSATEIQQLYNLSSTNYLWSTGATTPTINVSPSTTTTYTCTVTTNGVSCTNSATVVVNNPTINLGSDVTVCGTSTTLTVPTGYDSYSWSNGGTANTTTVSANGTYTCTVTQGLCSGSDAIDVTLIDATITASDSVICAGETVTLSIPQGGSSNTACAALPTNLQSGLVGYWPFCGNANDASGNGNNGTVNGATLTNDRFGNAGSAYSFDGNSNKIITGSSSTCNPGYADFSISGWIKTTDASGIICSKSLGDSQQNPQNNDWYVLHINSGKLEFELTDGYSGPGDYVLLQSTITINDGLFHFFTFVFDRDGNGSIYIDNMLNNSTSISGFQGDISPLTNLEFGYDTEHLTNYLFGVLDDINYWNRIVTEQEITQLYNIGQATYTWTNGATTPTINVSPTTTTTYTCTVTTNGVSCTDSVTVIVNNSTIDLGSDVTACGTSTTLTAPTGYDSYLWSNGSATNTTTVTASGTYTCTVTQGLCSVSDSIDVTLIDATISASDSTICAGETVTLSIPQGGSSNTACVALPTNLQSGLVGYWPFCGNANDASGNGNNGTVNGATLTTDRFGSANNAYSFDGNDYIMANSIASTNLSVSVWYKSDVNSIYNTSTGHPPIGQQLIGQGTQHSPTAYCDYALGLTSYNSGVQQIALEQSLPPSTYFQMYYANTSFNYSNWDNLTLTVQGTTAKIYKNGNILSTFTFTGSLQNIGSVLAFGARYVGNSGNPLCNYYNGLLDDITIWNRALTASEIQQLYTQGQISYSWSNGATTPTINVSPTSTTTYTCTVTTNGVSCTDSVTVVVNNPTIDLGSDVTVCGTATEFTAPTGYDSYLWSNGATTNTTTVTSNGTYSCTVTQGLCSATDSIDITLIDATISASDSTICAGTSVTLSASGSSNTACAALPTNLQTGLVGYWPFCGNANDESGNGNNGVVYGATLTTDRFGNANSAYSFDGVDDYIVQNSNNTFQSPALTFSCWTYALQLNQYFNCIVKKGNFSDAQNESYGFGLKQPNNIWTGVKGQTCQPGQLWVKSDFSLNPDFINNWRHLVITYSNNVISVFVDGTLIGSEVDPGFLDHCSGGQIVFGAEWANGITPFNGKLDDIVMFNRALSASEIQQLFTLGQSTYLWSTGATTANISVTPTQTTTYNCTVTTNGISCTDSVTVVVNNPTIDLGNDVTACGTSTTLTAPTGFDSYLWSNGAITNTTTVTSNGTYSCTVTQGDCSASDSIEVVLVPLTINTTNISAAAAYTWENNGQTYTSSGIYTGTTVNCETQVLNLTITPLSASLSLQVFLDGYYTNSSNLAAMTAARYNNLVASGSTTPGAATDVDVITVELRSPSNLDVVAYSVSPILQTNGSVQCVFPAGALGGSFYIVVKHRAAIPLWSAVPMLISNGTAINFSNNVLNSFSDGDPLYPSVHELNPGLYGLWMGELYYDSYLDGNDYPLFEVDVNSSSYADLYLLNGDLNGNTYVDASDYSVFNYNSQQGVYEQRPYAITTNVSIGQSYQGGIVAYILQPGDIGYDATMQHGLIAAPSDQGYAPWGCGGTLISGADGTAIGTGNQNTLDIMTGCNEAGIAARLCGDLVLGGYSDWYLPSLDELNKLYLNRVAIGGFDSSDYWSSTEGSNGGAWIQIFSNGLQGHGNKLFFFNYDVRAVRSF